MHANSADPTAEEAPRRQRCLLAVSMFLCVASFGLLEPFVPLFLELNGLDRGQIGLVAGCGAGLAVLVQPFLGRLSDRIDARRPLMIAAAVLAGISYHVYGRSATLPAFLLLTAVGVNSVMYLNTANAVLVGRLASRPGATRGCGGTFASYRVWGSVGYVVLSLIAGLLLSRTLAGGVAFSRDAVAPVFLWSPLLFGCIALVACFVPDLKKEAVLTGGGCPVPTLDRLPAPACARNLRRFLRAYFFYIFAYTGCSAYISLYLKSLGASPLWITSVFTAGVVCEVFVMSQVGRLSDRFGRRPLLALTFALMPVRLLLYIPATSPLWVLCVQSLHGVNFGIMVAVSVAFISDLCEESQRGAAQAAMAGTGGIAAALGPAVGGWIAARWGIPSTFGVMAVVAGIGAATFLWKVRESHPRPVRLYRVGPEPLRPALRLLCVPIAWFSRLPRLRRGGE